MRTQRLVWLSLALILAGQPARAFFLKTGLKQTTGTGRYVATDVWAHFGDDWSLKPRYSQYHSDSSSGTYKTLSLRAAYDTKLWGLGLSAGGTPKVNGYSNRFFAIDATVTITPTGGSKSKRTAGGSDQEERGKGLARVDLGAGLTHTTHQDEFQADGVRRARALNIGQTDLDASVSASLFRTVATVEVTKSLYDRDLNAQSPRAAQAVSRSGLASVIQGFPDTTAFARFELSMVPVVKPFVSYARTTFKLRQPHSDAYAVGGFAGLKFVELTASYERYVQAGRPSQNYFGLGAALKF